MPGINCPSCAHPIQIGGCDRLRAQLSALRHQIEIGGCAVASEGETTYECRVDTLCGLCRMRNRAERAEQERDEARALVVANSREYGEIYAELESRIAEVERERDTLHALAERSVADALVRSRETVHRVTWVDHVTGECCESTEVMSADMTRAGNAIASAIRMLVIANAKQERDAAVALRDEAEARADICHANHAGAITKLREERDAMRAERDEAVKRANEMHRRAQSAEGFRDRSFRYQRHLIETSMERDQERSRRERAEARAERAERACVDIFNAFATSRSIDQAISVRNAWTLGREIVVGKLNAKCGSGS